MVDPFPAQSAGALVEAFAEVDAVIADPLRFKLRLGIGEDAYSSLKLKKKVQQLWDVGGMAATGAGIASSKLVATTFFSGGLLSFIGIGTATTPIGWVAAAAVATGGAYYGVTRLFRGYSTARVDTIPRFINTPIDILGASLFDMMGSLCIKVAQMDGHVARSEIDAVRDHFVGEWGYDPSYVEGALTVLLDGADKQTLSDMAATLAAFHRANPDCNPASMSEQLVALLRDIASSDGRIDEREILAIEKVEAMLAGKDGISIGGFGSQLRQLPAALGRRIRGASRRSD